MELALDIFLIMMRRGLTQRMQVDEQDPLQAVCVNVEKAVL